MWASEIADLLGAELQGSDIEVYGCCSASHSKDHCASFIKSEKNLHLVNESTATCLWILPADCEIDGVSFLKVKNPRDSFSEIMRHFYRRVSTGKIHASTSLGKNCEIHETVEIGKNCVVGDNVWIGKDTLILNNVVIGSNVTIGVNCYVKSNSVIGEEGFGISYDTNGNTQRLPHIGGVMIGDHVEIGSLNTVCSGTIDPTKIDSWTKLDDHVHVAHNCQIGKNCIITACAELSGSVSVGDRVWIAPNASVAESIQIGSDSFVGIGSVVTKHCKENSIYAGNPARFVRTKEARE